MKPIYIIAFVVLFFAMVAAAAEVRPQWFTEQRGLDNIKDLSDWNSFFNRARSSNLFLGRVHDDEKKVTCWIVSGPARGGISCISDKDLVP